MKGKLRSLRASCRRPLRRLVVPGSNATEYDVRLEGGRFPREGRIEVFAGGRWSELCYHGVSIPQVSAVVCRELGFAPATHLWLSPDTDPKASAVYSPGLHTLAVEFHCTGQEDSLSECPRTEVTEAECPPSMSTVGVICEQGENNMIPDDPHAMLASSSSSSSTCSSFAIAAVCCVCVCVRAQQMGERTRTLRTEGTRPSPSRRRRAR